MITEQYLSLVSYILDKGEKRETRNAPTASIFGATMRFNLIDDGFPILTCRKIFHEGIQGEFKAFIEDVSTIKRFKHFGCNYWDKWADEEGNLTLDYPPREQLNTVIELIKNDPTSRRIMINLWDHKRLDKLSLPCCHFNYQFYVRDKEYLDMIWTQRSVDVAVGLPADLILAALYTITIANECRLQPGDITMNFGDTHIYLDHVFDLLRMKQEYSVSKGRKINWKLDSGVLDFLPGDLQLLNYDTDNIIKFKLHG